MKIVCRSCDQQRSLKDDFRLFSSDPLLYMDFCMECERRWGTLTLYRRYAAYSTLEIQRAVFAAERTPKLRRTFEQTRLLLDPVLKTEPATNEEVIRQELLRRELARRRLMAFVDTFHDSYKAGWVHHDMCRRLENFMRAVERLESPRLMLFLPPRAGKSEIASKNLVAWMLGHHPEWEIISASYGLQLPTDYSRWIRDVVRNPEYQAIFPHTLIRADSQAIESWKTTKGGGLTCAGIGVGITGKGMHVGILDDPIKDYEAAQSEVIRESTFGWYQSTFATRLAPGGGVIVIMTRWHDADVAGRLLLLQEELTKAGIPDAEIDKWEVVSYPAIAEHHEFLMKDGSIAYDKPFEDENIVRLLRRRGEALHPERFPLPELMKKKHTTLPSIWASMYQQNPVPDDGEFFKSADFSFRQLSKEYWPQGRILSAWDFAITEKRRNDYTVGVVGVLTPSDDLYIIDIRRGRWQSLDIVAQMIDVIERYHPYTLGGERGQIYEAIWPLLKREMQRRRLYCSYDETLVPITDKEARARPLQGRMQHRRLHFSLPEDHASPTMEEVRREMLRFPSGVHDDIVDALAWLARLSMNVSLPTLMHSTKRLKSWKDDLTIPSHIPTHMAS